jgi:hypothetical protein
MHVFAFCIDWMFVLNVKHNVRNRSMRSVNWELFSIIGGPCRRYVVARTRMLGHRLPPGAACGCFNREETIWTKRKVLGTDGGVGKLHNQERPARFPIHMPIQRCVYIIMIDINTRTTAHVLDIHVYFKYPHTQYWPVSARKSRKEAPAEAYCQILTTITRICTFPHSSFVQSCSCACLSHQGYIQQHTYIWPIYKYMYIYMYLFIYIYIYKYMYICICIYICM